MIKKYIILSLVLFLFLQVVGVYHFELIQHKHFKELALNNKKHADLETVTISLTEFKSLLVIDNETYINDELYDIIHIEIDNEIVTLSLYKDSDEKNSKIKIKNTHKKSRSSKGKNSSITKTSLFCAIQSNLVLSSKQYFAQKKINFIHIKAKNIVLEIIVPPPEFLNIT